MIPIGIVTRNRAAYLDVTLRSLSGTLLPPNQRVIVFDDASDGDKTLQYLYTDKPTDLRYNWPTNHRWRQLGLHCVQSRHNAPGLQGLVEVVKLGDKPQGVVNGTCKAIQIMRERFPNSRGLLMLQDDVVFKKDWRLKMLRAARLASQRPVGLVCGMWSNKRPKAKAAVGQVCIRKGGITAQCYYITPQGLEAVDSWIKEHHQLSAGFDNKFCAAMRTGGATVYLVRPAVVQHIGIVSHVRPKWKWTRLNPKGRIDYSARGPYVMAAEVRSFVS